MASIDLLSQHRLTIEANGFSHTSFHQGTWMHHLDFKVDSHELGCLSTGPGFSAELRRFLKHEISYFHYEDNFEKNLPCTQLEVTFERIEGGGALKIDVFKTYYLDENDESDYMKAALAKWQKLVESLRRDRSRVETSQYEENILHFSFLGGTHTDDYENFCKELLAEIEADLKTTSRPGGWSEVGTIVTE